MEEPIEWALLQVNPEKTYAASKENMLLFSDKHSEPVLHLVK